MEIEHRPWGYYEIINECNEFKAKRITVFPNKN